MTQKKRNLGKIKGGIVGIQYYDAEATSSRAKEIASVSRVVHMAPAEE